jgi:hypothetical protein
MWAGSGNKLHILWQCLSARDVWSMGNKKLQNSATIGLCFPEVIENLFDKCSQEDMVQFAGLARRIWFRRNELELNVYPMKCRRFTQKRFGFYTILNVQQPASTGMYRIYSQK